LPLGSDDPVIAARAVRRAIAAAGRRAVDVSALVIATQGPLDAEVVAAFARRALGPHGGVVRARGLAVQGNSAEALAATAAAKLGADLSSDGIGIAVGIDDGGNVVALCLGRTTTAPGAGPPGAA
jgi:hypothetical protein